MLNDEPEKALALFEGTLGTAGILNVRQGEQPDATYYGQASYVAWAVQRRDLAERWSAASNSLEPNNSLAAYIQALLARGSGDYEQALAKLAIVRAEPDPQRYEEPFCNPRFNHQLDADEGRILALMGRTDEAIEAFQRAIAATQDWASPYVELAALYDAQGEREKASDLVRMALNLPRAQTDQALRGQLEALLAQYSSTATPVSPPSRIAPTSTRVIVPTPTRVIVPTPQLLPDPVPEPVPPTQTPKKGDDDDDDDDDD